MVSSEPPVGVGAAASYVRGVLGPLSDRANGGWGAPAGTLEWSCRRTLAHMADACNWYAALLARRATADVEVGTVDQTWQPRVMLDALTSAASVLDAGVAAADPADRGWWHGRGAPDRTGLAAMGCDEVLVHGFDIATSFACEYEPPGDLCAGVVRRLFPWAPPRDVERRPWATLL